MGDKMLTKKQYKLLDFIDKYQKRSGISPSFEEMKIGLGLKSKSGIHRLVKNLEDRDLKSLNKQIVKAGIPKLQG